MVEMVAYLTAAFSWRRIGWGFRWKGSPANYCWSGLLMTASILGSIFQVEDADRGLFRACTH